MIISLVVAASASRWAEDEDMGGQDGDIIADGLSLTVDDHGVVARLSGPLARFSGTYPWRAVPIGLAALCVLTEVHPVEEHPQYEPFEPWEPFELLLQMLRHVGVTENDLEEALGPDWSNAQKIWDSSPVLASRCPYASVATEIEQLSQMPTRDVGSYLLGFFG